MIEFIWHYYISRPHFTHHYYIQTSLHSPHQCCLAAVLDGVRSSASGLTSSQAGDYLMPTSDCWPQLVLPSAVSSRAELTSCHLSNDSFTQSWPHRKHRFQQFLYFSHLIRCLAVDIFTEPFPISGRLCWFHNSGFQQTCYNILMPGVRNRKFKKGYLHITLLKIKSRTMIST
jgi:hypothetical protein